MKLYNRVFFEIAGVCNAKCPYCVSGTKHAPPGSFISIDKFVAVIDRLFTTKVIDQKTSIFLFIKGEPFLHPHINELLEILHSRQLSFELSTNASVCPSVNATMAAGMTLLTVSMPGFSQESYDRIHRFDFEEIKRNIVTTTKALREHGYLNQININYHLYQFSLEEIHACEEFANEHGLYLHPMLAYLNDWDQITEWLEGKTPPTNMRKMMEELLFFSEYRRLMKNAPKDHVCDQFRTLVINEEGEMITCCGINKGHPDYGLGSILDTNMETLLERKTNRPVCVECHRSGLPYALEKGCSSRAYLFRTDQRNSEKVMIGNSVRRVVIFGTGEGAHYASELAQRCGWEVVYYVDNDETRWGGEASGKAVRSPQDLAKRDFDAIIVASSGGKTKIFPQLNSMGFSYPNDYIYVFDTIKLGSSKISVTPQTATGF